MTGFSANNVKAADYGLSNPRVDSEGNVTWDCAYFGSYNQTATWVKEPIKWRVLSVDENNNALIVADKNLDCKKYNETEKDVTWETCTLRSWLNGYGADSNIEGIDYSTDSFIDEAFTEEEQAAINTTTVINNDNPEFGTDGGNDTEDKVYLLSIEEVSNTEYGFESTFGSDSNTREVANTEYTEVKGAYTYYGSGFWMLRSPGSALNAVSYVGTNGMGFNDDHSVVDPSDGVRPALCINLSSASIWTEAGVTDSEGNDGVSRDNTIDNPIVENGVTTWDCIYFGSYNQTLKGWTKEPIKWRVLSVDGDDAFFIADKNLDCRKYNETKELITWEMSTLRSWLNGYGASSNGDGIDYSTDNFMNKAFTEEEQAAINTTTVINNDNHSYETDGGNNTEDKVYLLSIEEASNAAYGLENTFDYESKTREVKNTEYAKVNGAYANISSAYFGNGFWWLRSPGRNLDAVCYVNCYGSGSYDGMAVNYYDYNGVRPVININLSSSLWENAGTVTSVMTSYGEQGTESPTPTTDPEETEKPADGIEPTSEPTQAPVVTQAPASVVTPTIAPAPVQTVAPTEVSKADENVSKTDEVKTFKLSSVKIKKNTTKITGKVSVSKATVKIKVGSKAWKKATVKGKKFTFKTAKLKKNTKVQIKVSKKGYKTLKKSFKVK